MNSNFVDHELIAGFEWNMHDTQIDLTWLVFAFYNCFKVVISLNCTTII